MFPIPAIDSDLRPELPGSPGGSGDWRPREFSITTPWQAPSNNSPSESRLYPPAPLYFPPLIRIARSNPTAVSSPDHAVALLPFGGTITVVGAYCMPLQSGVRA